MDPNIYSDVEFLVSKKEIHKRIREITSFSDETYYSYKTNPFIGDYIASNNLLPLSLNLFYSLQHLSKRALSRSIYYLQGEDKQLIKKIVDMGITRFVVDNEPDLSRLLEVTLPKELFIRVKFREHTFYTGKNFVFGISWKKLLGLIKHYNLDRVDSLGLHFHRKTQNIGDWYITHEFKYLFPSEAHRFIQKVNIGGGIPFVYANSQPDVSTILRDIASFRDYLHDHGLLLVIEPGRYIAAPSVKLRTRVINAYDNTLVVNASIHNAYIDTFLLNIRLRILDEQKQGYCYTIKGYTLDSLDIFRYKACFSSQKKVGDEIIFLDAGAYNFHCSFNYLPVIPYRFID